MDTSPIIRNAPPPPGRRLPGAIVRRELIAAREEARRLLDEAAEAVAAMRREAGEEIEEIHARAHAAAREEALAELNEHLLAARRLREQILTDSEQDILRLSVRIAEKIIGERIDTEPAAIASLVTAALRHVARSEAVIIRVNPAARDILAEHYARLLESGRFGYLDVVADPAVNPHGCLIETPAGVVDAQLRTQIDILERALLGEMEGKKSEE
ncbi:MAG: FliH/SctL family protein [Blastocatellia bacterium]